MIEDYKRAPLVNKGFWWLMKKDNEEIEISYFSMIQPPLPIPAWLYKQIVKDSYEEVFRKLILRTMQIP